MVGEDRHHARHSKVRSHADDGTQGQVATRGDFFLPDSHLVPHKSTQNIRLEK